MAKTNIEDIDRNIYDIKIKIITNLKCKKA